MLIYMPISQEPIEFEFDGEVTVYLIWTEFTSGAHGWPLPRPDDSGI